MMRIPLGDLELLTIGGFYLFVATVLLVSIDYTVGHLRAMNPELDKSPGDGLPSPAHVWHQNIRFCLFMLVFATCTATCLLVLWVQSID